VFKLSLTISDLNDNSPVFQPSQLTLDVPETAAPGSVYVLPAAVDQDHGLNDVTSYTMTSNATEHFRLHVTGTGSDMDVQLVVAGELDHETESVYTATVTAVDGGTPSKSGSVDVIIRIQVSMFTCTSLFVRNTDSINTTIRHTNKAEQKSVDNLCDISTITDRAAPTGGIFNITRSSATAEKQRVSCPHGGG